MFRTNSDFSFPYQQDGKAIEKNRRLSRDLFIDNKWSKAIHSFKWLIEKFNPPDWDGYLK